MATEKQVVANRKNALKSTGPRSLRGKNVVRFNAVRHGLRANRVLLPGEPEEEFYAYCSEMQAEWQPVGPTEEHYLEQMVVAQWKLRRVESCTCQFYGESVGETLPVIDRLWKAEQRFENSFIRAQHELERLQAARLDSGETAQLAEFEKAPEKVAESEEAAKSSDPAVPEPEPTPEPVPSPQSPVSASEASAPPYPSLSPASDSRPSDPA